MSLSQEMIYYFLTINCDTASILIIIVLNNNLTIYFRYEVKSMFLTKMNKLGYKLVASIIIVIFCLSLTIFVIPYLDQTIIIDDLFFKLFGKSFYSDIFVWYPDGTIKNISPSHDGIYFQGNINPDGTSVVFYGNDVGNPVIWKADLISGNVYALTSDEYSSRHPVFSWDGSQIAFSASIADKNNNERIELLHGNGIPPKNLTLNIFVMNSNGDNQRQITFGNYQDQRPTFSPDGNIIVFVSNRSNPSSTKRTDLRLWSVPVDGSEEPKPLQIEGWAFRPWFSSDGKLIYFISGVNGGQKIFYISSKGGDINPLEIDCIGNCNGLYLDPYKNAILMHSKRDGSYKIYELPLDGKKFKVLQPEGFDNALHATRSKNDIIVFDSSRRRWVRKFVSNIRVASCKVTNFYKLKF